MNPCEAYIVSELYAVYCYVILHSQYSHFQQTSLKLKNARRQLRPVVQRLDNAILRIKHYLVDKCWQNKLPHPLAGW